MSDQNTPANDTSSRLDSLPPLWAFSGMILAGLVIGFAIPVTDGAPTDFSQGLAKRRLERYEPVPAESGPVDEILTDRPVFFWPKKDGAMRYELIVRKVAGNGTQGRTWLGPIVVDGSYHVLKAPGHLDRGATYEFETQALSANGSRMGSVASGTFSVVEKLPENLARLVAAARAANDAAGCALAMAGVYSEQGTPFDVAAELAAYLDAASGGESAQLARSVLNRVGCR
ncbi:MAG: hypothetical protein V3T86_09400 [Planctomycetota bacterium]